MIFNEIYSAYYNAVADVLKDAVNGVADEKSIYKSIEKYAFAESVLQLYPALTNGKWKLLKEDFTTCIKNSPTMPLDNLQKRWLRSILDDPRIKLFDFQIKGLDGVEPLFTKEDYEVYDKYLDGDPYEDDKYLAVFKTVFSAIKNGKPLAIKFLNRKGKVMTANVLPKALEYSEKDDKFRLLVSNDRSVKTINLARVVECYEFDGKVFDSFKEDVRLKTAEIKIKDQRGALERAILHFAHFDKRAEKLKDDQYLLTVNYNVEDETEIAIRVLSFGPFIEVLKPLSLRKVIINRLLEQRQFTL